MKKQYKITKEKYLEAQRAIFANGGKVYRNDTFEIQGVEGAFKFFEEKEIIVIVITDKPWLASWEMIEKKLDEFFK